MYVPGTVAGTELRAWAPAVDGVVEVLHARFSGHAYPMHTHDTWALLVVDRGRVVFDLERHQHAALDAVVTLLPPHVPHNGRAATHEGFRKRVVYLREDVLDASLLGRAADQPGWLDRGLRAQIEELHGALEHPGDGFAAECGLAAVASRLEAHLRAEPPDDPAPADAPLVHRLRTLLDDHVTTGISLAEAGRLLGAHPAHLVRSFRRHTGIAPHQYLLGRRLDLARGLLLRGRPAAEVAALAGFHDQSHLTRHFKRLLGVTPARFAASAGPPGRRGRCESVLDSGA